MNHWINAMMTLPFISFFNKTKRLPFSAHVFLSSQLWNRFVLLTAWSSGLARLCQRGCPRSPMPGALAFTPTVHSSVCLHIYESVLFFFNFNWKLITLQYCSGFCRTLTWISHRCTCVPIPNPLPLPSPSHPSGSSQCTSPEHPVSCIKPGLVICFTYGNIHVSMLFSQIIPPSPSPTESKSLFFTPVSLVLSCI